MKNKRTKKSRINTRKTLFCLTIFLLLILGTIIIMGNNKTSSFVETKYKTFHVSSGETLWEIAKIESANNSYYEDKDIRYIVKDIKNINNMNSSNLYEGQELMIPSL